MTQQNDAIVERVAREALFGEEIARTDVVKPVNGAAPYSIVLFHGQRVAFHDGEFDNSFERDAGSSKAAAFATKINDALFELAKRSARAALTAPAQRWAGSPGSSTGCSGRATQSRRSPRRR